jgi:hypothetical protein
VPVGPGEVDGQGLDDIHPTVLLHVEVGDVRRDRGRLVDTRVHLRVLTRVVEEQRRQEEDPHQQRESTEGRNDARHGAQTTRAGVHRSEDAQHGGLVQP